jgi:hypothetical protein
MTAVSPIIRPLSQLLAREAARPVTPSKLLPVPEARLASPLIYRQCSWCGGGMGSVRAKSLMAGSISHGLCAPCKNKMLAPLTRPAASPAENIIR